mgnify:CR=1 FL=1
MWEPPKNQSPLIINDRRGQKKEPRPEPVPEVAEESGEKESWKDTAYMVVMMRTPSGTMVAGRAVGERSDGRVFVADWIFPPVWQKETEWTQYAQKRLDKYLGSKCIETEVCSDHKRYLPQWGQADMDRLNRIATQAVPSCIETLMRAEQARQSALYTPGR